jgi:hypothetical protein
VIDQSTFLWVVGAAVSIIGALVATIHAADRRRYDELRRHIDEQFSRLTERLEDHIQQDGLVHERVRATEIEISNVKTEVFSLREKWHDLRSEVTRNVSTWYADVVALIEKRLPK